MGQSQFYEAFFAPQPQTKGGAPRKSDVDETEREARDVLKVTRHTARLSSAATK